MKKFSKIILIFLILIVELVPHISVSADDESNGYIVKIKTSASSLRLFSAQSFNQMEEISAEEGLYYVDSPSDIPPGTVVENIEPNVKMHLSYIPNDTQYSRLWYLDTVNAPDIWEAGCYGNDVKVAVIDTGVNAHSDLIQNYIPGHNFIKDNDDVTDNQGHGTAVAGIIAAAGNNKYMGSGVAFRAKIVPLKCFDTDSSDIRYTISAIYSAIKDYKCNVINISAGTPSNSQNLKEAIDFAVNSGAIVVAASGNHDSKTPNKVNYPAGYDNVISVAAVNQDKVVSDFSNYDKHVTVCAPGENMPCLSAKNAAGWAIGWNGTSFACPVVAGAAAVCLSIDPSLTNDGFKKIIESTSTDLGNEGRDDYYGYGLLNLKQILEYMLKGKNYFVSMYDDIDDNPGITVYNNTDAKYNGFGILFDGNVKKTVFISNESKRGTKIFFTAQNDSFSYKLWTDKLKPVFSKNFIKKKEPENTDPAPSE